MNKFLLLYLTGFSCFLIAECDESPTKELQPKLFSTKIGEISTNCKLFSYIDEQYVQCFKKLPEKVQEIIKNGAGTRNEMEALKKFICRDEDALNKVIDGMSEHKINFTEQDRKFMGCVFRPPKKAVKPSTGPVPRPAPRPLPRPAPGPIPRPGPAPATKQ